MTGSVRGFCPLPKFDLHPLYFFLLTNSRTSRRIWRTHDGEPDPTLLDIIVVFVLADDFLCLDIQSQHVDNRFD